jgi:TPR repeat protein
MNPKKILKKPDKLFIEANAAWDKGDLQRAFTLFLQAAKMGDRSSQLDLGYFFDNGLYVKKNWREALQWYHKAYEQGDASGANNIATVYRDMGDTQKMLWWYRKAVAMGDDEVLLELGKRYEAGLEVSENKEKAKEFYHRVVESAAVSECAREEAGNRLASLEKKCRKGVTH